MSTPKKYTDFPAGTYNTSKIFLQADPVTGALEKINLPSISSGPSVKPLAYAIPSQVISTTTETDIINVTIPAGSLSANGMTIMSSIIFQFGSSGSKTFKVYINGSSTGTITEPNVNSLAILTSILARIDATHILPTMYLTRSSPFSGTSTSSALNINTANAITIRITATNTVANMLTVQQGSLLII